MKDSKKHKAVLTKIMKEYEKGNNLKELIEKLNDDLKISVNYQSAPGIANLNSIKSTGETAFQRGIFNSKISKLEKKDKLEAIEWIDLEIPVVLNKEKRRECIDIIGINGDKLVLVELKFGKDTIINSTNNPYYGIFELLIYHYFLINNYSKLDNFEVYHKNEQIKSHKFKWSEYILKDNLRLLFVANKKYFEVWIKEGNINKNELFDLLKRIEKDLNIQCEIFQTQDEDFKSQMAGNQSYKPIVSKNPWISL